MMLTRCALLSLSIASFAATFAGVCEAQQTSSQANTIQPTGASAPPMQPQNAALDESSYDHGPRAGFMRGGGALQAELLLGPGSGFRMYFIDKHWIDVDLSGARVEGVLMQQGAGGAAVRQAITCSGRPTPEKPAFFVCDLPKNAVFAIGDRVFIKHVDASGKETSFNYTFPFKPHEPIQDYPAAPTSGAAAASTASTVPAETKK